MMKDLLFHQQQQQQQQALEENMSNLTSASGEASVSSGNRTEAGTNYPQQYFTTPPPPQTQSVKKKRNLPGNPDPDAEVIALSPKTLITKNRFVCEICNKGFQRDQNLQLHRRGHNLPWKLKQRASKEVKKKVYVCPEPSCVHHDPSRALGDLTGIKKHFFRKHGEKKWKCDKCSKRYAVHSDWKAHSKTCGTREYRCDCGTVFSRRDSFITHRAFCDALAEESARAITGSANPLLLSQGASSASASHINLQVPQFNINPQDNIHLQPYSLKKEQQQSFTAALRPEIPPWLASQQMLGVGPGPPQPIDLSSSSSSIFSSRLDHHQEFTQTHHQDLTLHGNPSPSPGPSLGPTLSTYHPATVPSPHMSATALLQKAAQMGATMSNNKTGSSSTSPATASLMRPHQQTHVSADSAGSNRNIPAGFGLNLTSREEQALGSSSSSSGFIHGSGAPPPSLLQDMMMNSLSSATGFDATSFDDIAFGTGVLNAKKAAGSFISETRNDHETGTTTATAQGEGLTRDFLGLRAFSHSDILNIAGLSNCMNTSHGQVRNQTDKPWRG